MLSLLSREGSMVNFRLSCVLEQERFLTVFYSLASDFVASRSASHDLKSIMCPSLAVNALVRVTPSILHFFNGLVLCKLSGNDQMLQARAILLPQKECRRNQETVHD